MLMANKSLCGRQSNAFDNSVRRAPKESPLSITDFYFTIMAYRQYCVLYLYLSHIDILIETVS